MSPKIKLRFRSLINRSAAEIYDWHLRPRCSERCIPPSEKTEMLSSEGRPYKIGSKLTLRIRLFGFFWVKEVFEYTDSIENEAFTLRQSKGYFEDYIYKMRITEQSEHTSEIIDRIELTHSCFRFLAPLLNGYLNGYLRRRIAKMLAYKHDVIFHDIGMIKKYPFEKPFKILVSGSHGLIGKNLAYFLEFMGHDVWHLSRSDSDEAKSVVWNPKTGECNPEDFEGFDVIVHLAGENIAKGWWTEKKKKRVLASRIEGTEKLVEIIKRLKHPPEAFLSASAIGYYGDRGNKVLTEESGPGRDFFITEVCEKWERVTKELEEKGIRVSQTRFGVVLSSAGGVLKRLLLPFKWGLGGKIGNGHQYVSWVAIDDVVGALYHIMMTPKLQGAVNVVSPHPVPNNAFSKSLAKRLNRWLGPPLPELFIKMTLGQKGEELLLASTRVDPYRLSESGYQFHYPKLYQALEHVI